MQKKWKKINKSWKLFQTTCAWSTWIWFHCVMTTTLKQRIVPTTFFMQGFFVFLLFIQLVWWLLCILGTLKQNLYTRKCAHFTPCFCQSRCYWPYDEYSWNLTKIRCSIFGQTLNTCRCDHLPKIDCNQSKIFICILNGKWL